MGISRIIGLLALSLLLLSCGDTPLYQKSISFENRKWTDDQDLFYEFDSKNDKQVLDFKLMLRTTTDFSYSNLWIFFTTETPSGQVERQPYQIRICNDDGSWIGKKSGSIVETSLDFADVLLPEKGVYKFKVEQGITLSEVDEILDMTLTVTENQP